MVQNIGAQGIFLSLADAGKVIGRLTLCQIYMVFPFKVMAVCDLSGLRSQFATLKKWWSQTLTVKSRSYNLEVTICDFKDEIEIATSRFKAPKWHLKNDFTTGG